MASMSDGRDTFFMQQALDQARRAGEEGEVPVGAVVVRDGAIIGRGRNACERLQDATAHAEMLAITAASNTIETWRLEGCTCYVTLEPCPMCLGAMLNSRIERVVFAAREPKAGACGSVFDLVGTHRYNHQVAVEEGICAEDSRALLQAFFRQLRAEKKRQRALGADGERDALM